MKLRERVDSLITGWATDNEGRRYCFAYDPDTEVGVTDFGGAYRDVTTAGSWKPGDDPSDALCYGTLVNAWDYSRGQRDRKRHPFGPVALGLALVRDGAIG